VSLISAGSPGDTLSSSLSRSCANSSMLSRSSQRRLCDSALGTQPVLVFVRAQSVHEGFLQMFIGISLGVQQRIKNSPCPALEKSSQPQELLSVVLFIHCCTDLKVLKPRSGSFILQGFRQGKAMATPDAIIFPDFGTNVMTMSKTAFPHSCIFNHRTPKQIMCNYRKIQHPKIIKHHMCNTVTQQACSMSTINNATSKH